MSLTAEEFALLSEEEKEKRAGEMTPEEWSRYRIGCEPIVPHYVNEEKKDTAE